MVPSELPSTAPGASLGAECPRPGTRQAGPTRRLVLKDRGQANRYFVVIEFDSYEDAMRNSDDPETTKFAEQMAALCTRPPSFTDCDVQEMTDFA